MFHFSSSKPYPFTSTSTTVYSLIASLHLCTSAWHLSSECSNIFHHTWHWPLLNYCLFQLGGEPKISHRARTGLSRHKNCKEKKLAKAITALPPLRSAVLLFSTALAQTAFILPRYLSKSFAAPLRQAVRYYIPLERKYFFFIFLVHECVWAMRMRKPVCIEVQPLL